VLRAIARGHVAARATIEAMRPPLIIEDTDIVMTSAWFRMLHRRRDKAMTAIPATADSYLLFSPDTPWIDDATRQFGGAQRLRFHAIIVDELKRRSIVPTIVEGIWPQRQARAEAAVTAILARAQGVTLVASDG
jgi:nicotinamide riboside kinase